MKTFSSKLLYSVDVQDFNHCFTNYFCLLYQKKPPEGGFFRLHHVQPDYFFRPRMTLASSEVATSRPSNLAMRTTLSTSSPLDFANTPFSR